MWRKERKKNSNLIQRRLVERGPRGATPKVGGEEKIEDNTRIYIYLSIHSSFSLSLSLSLCLSPVLQGREIQCGGGEGQAIRRGGAEEAAGGVGQTSPST